MIRRRAFALPLVIALALIASVLAAMALERQTAHNLTIQRQIEAYGTRHLERGLAEVIGTWLGSVRARGLAESLDERGVGLTIQAESGSMLEVRFEDAQGAALASVNGLIDENRVLVLDILGRLQLAVGPAIGSMIRDVGPIAVSVNTAPEPVLRAAVEASLARDGAGPIVDAILGARSGDDRITTESMARILEDAGVAPEVRAHLEGVLAVNPVLWRIVVTPRFAGGEAATFRYEGLAWISGPRDRDQGRQRNSPIVSMRKVEMR